jgi:hypothetical protein
MKPQDKVAKVMREFKAGELHSGQSDKVVKNPKQAIAIALSEAGKSKPKGENMNRMKSKGEHTVQTKAKRGAEVVKMAKGGYAKGGGIETKGKTRGKMVKMMGGGKC